MHDKAHGTIRTRAATTAVARDLLVLAALAAVLLTWAIGVSPIVARGEAREALVVRELVAGGSWVVPRRQGRLATKPPLYHWLAASIARVRGRSDAVMRAPSAAAALIVLLVTFAIGFRVGGRPTAWVAAGVLASTPGFWRWGTEARVDMLLAACTTASVAGFASWQRTGTALGRASFWIAAALGALAKGPIGAILPGAVALSVLMVEGERSRVRALVATPACGLSVGLVLGWYALGAILGGAEFVRVHLLVENLERLVGAGAFAGRDGRRSFVVVRAFASHLLPWNLTLGWYAWRRWRGMSASRDERVLHTWWITMLVILALPAGQRPVYVLPLQPPIAVLAAGALVALVPGWSRRAPALGGCALVLAAVGVLGVTQWLRARRAADEPLRPFAQAVMERVPPGAELRATHAVAESDVLVLGHLLARPLLRARPHCDVAHRYYLGPIPRSERASLRVLERLDRSGRERLALLRCKPVPRGDDLP